jgi:modulator of FtsH protease HflC
MTNRGLFTIIGLAVVLIIAANTLFIVTEYQRAVVLEFGRLVKMDVKPGLHFKIPFAQTVRKFDARLLTADLKTDSFFTVENKRLMVDSFVKWQVSDVETYYKVTGGDELTAESRLEQRVLDGLRNQFGRRTLHDVVSGKRDELMSEITTSINADTIKLLGIEVKDIRVKRIDFPSEVSQSVFARMSADREKEAREYRSQGKEEAEKIQADADKQRTILLAEAYRDAERLRGEGDAQAAAIFAKAYSKDAEFYSFVRSLNAYKMSFANKDDLMVLDPKSEFFRFLKDSQGKK